MGILFGGWANDDWGDSEKHIPLENNADEEKPMRKTPEGRPGKPVVCETDIITMSPTGGPTYYVIDITDNNDLLVQEIENTRNAVPFVYSGTYFKVVNIAGEYDVLTPRPQ